ncbi:MAG: hypothetical protein MJ233_01020 [Mycoplasmoidaceae bacterium]|nr:hypothetical protein [Mycoplasmoidaceae bacterium]
MKLKAKLIPIAGIAATIATVAPISLTSCGQLNGGTFNLVNGYQAQYERLEQGNMTLKDMNDAYTKHLVENPMVFIDDMY